MRREGVGARIAASLRRAQANAQLVSRPVLRRVGRVTGVVTPLGWGVIALTVASGLGGLTMGWWELTTIALCGLVLLAVCALFLIGRTEYDVRLDLTQERVVVGERAVGTLELRNPGKRALLPSRVVLPVGRARPTFEVPRLAAGAMHDELFTIPTTRRGVLAVGPVSAVRGDPLGVLARTHEWSDPVDLYVHPATVPLDGATAGLIRDLEGLPTRDLSRDDVSFHALREYAPGDDLRHVHWKSTARTGIVMVRQFEDTRRSQVTIVLSSAAHEYANEDEYELAVSAAASLAVQARREGRELMILTHSARIRTDGTRHMLDSFSGIEVVRAPGGIGELAGRLAIEASRVSVAALITGTQASAGELQTAARRVPEGARTVTLLCPAAGSPSVRRTGSGAVARLGELRDLPPVMRGALS